MTIFQTLKLATAKLSAKSFDSPRLETEILLSHVLKKPCEFLLAHGEKKLSSSQISSFKLLISKRLNGEPAAHLIGHKEFYGLDFIVNKNVLIPRPETELMVEEALKLVAHNSQLATLIDVGTGSGCIIITLAKLFNESRITNHELWGIDISAGALAVASKNAKTHHVYKKIKFLKGNLLTPIINDSKFLLLNSYLIVLANLPYLTPKQIKNSPTIKHEPKSALAGGPDGLKYYRQLFRQIRDYITPLCVTCYALCEIDPGHTKKIKQLVKHELPQATCQIKKDLSGLDRLVIMKIV